MNQGSEPITELSGKTPIVDAIGDSRLLLAYASSHGDKASCQIDY